MNRLLSTVRYELQRYLPFFFDKLKRDRIPVNAGYLSYITLLSLVPLLGVMVAIFTAFPAFETVSTQVEHFVFENFVPASGEQIQQSLLAFVSNTKQMTTFGILFLVVVAMMLMAAVDRTIDDIWENPHRRGFANAFMLYWSVLTLGPLLIGGGIVASSYLLAFAEESLIANMGIQRGVLFTLPYLTSLLAFMMLYVLVPGKRVPLHHAFIGALVAALLYELSKKLFALYITGFSTYEALYGALAAVPILFIWVYISWIIILLGAEITYCLGHYRMTHKQAGQAGSNSF